MFMAPASPRAGTKRMRLCRAIASRIGMLWIEITPKAVVTPISARAWAIKSPTGSASVANPGVRAARVIPLALHVPRCAAGNLELRAGDEAGRRRAQERDRARDLLRRAQPLHRNVAGACDLGEPLLARLRLVLARIKPALPLAGIDEAKHHRIHAGAGGKFPRHRLAQAHRSGTRRRRRNPVTLGLVR